MSINFMHVGGAFALVGTALMVKNQLDDENYESAGNVLFEIAGVQIDLKIWLPLLTAIPLFLLGQVLATAKKTTEAAPARKAAPANKSWKQLRVDLDKKQFKRIKLTKVAKLNAEAHAAKFRWTLSNIARQISLLTSSENR